jgi:putative RNA 2'-phosphotransferase
MTRKAELASISKFMSLVLRHQPQSIGLTLDEAGWASIDELLAKASGAGKRLSRDLLHEIVAGNDKQRFALSEDGLRIRANQGHSIKVELGLAQAEPPAVLYHGTAKRFLDSVLASGLDKRRRHHVHMTSNIATAMSVGKRYGAPVLLEVDAARMRRDGHAFFQSENGVWLTDQVPSQYLTVRD